MGRRWALEPMWLKKLWLLTERKLQTTCLEIWRGELWVSLS